ncbi:hypothetical protein [uncultured Draconibacterium sp.]|uniref:hypothetical protein n=1 Tax=uncultured Draconibacterium sp. TaxID=1573823 RepID=UPI002AA9316B|nr:hypothetical protein [uncultured Draconibacterium sp.]
MTRYFIGIIILLLTLNSCKKRYELNTVYIFNKTLVAKNDTIDIPFKRIINGEYTYKINGSIIKKGTLKNSQNIGYWQYNIDDDNQQIDTSFIWKTENKLNHSLCYPSTWQSLENTDSAMLFVFDLQPEIEKETFNNYYLIILKRKIGEKSIESFNEYYINQAQEAYDVQANDNFKIILDGKTIGYYNRFYADAKYYLLNYNFCDNNYAYDISMKTNFPQDQAMNQLVFLEFIRSFSVRELPILPRKGLLEIKYLNEN